MNSSLLNGENAAYVDQMYTNWKADRNSVHASWDAYFTNVEQGVDPNLAFSAPPNLGTSGPGSPHVIVVNQGAPQVAAGGSSDAQEKLTRLFMKYRDLGHEIARVNPLTTEEEMEEKKTGFQDLSSSFQYHDFTAEELDRPISYFSNIPGIQNSRSQWTPREAASVMKELYCGPISFEYMHIGDAQMKQWIRVQIEKLPQIDMTKQEKLYLLDRVLESETFTNFCETKFPAAKRFGIEGCDTAISGLEMMCDHSKTKGVKNVVIGMAHRGRLNTLACVFDKTYDQIFGEFKDVRGVKAVEDEFGFAGDVKYHLGATNHRVYEDGNEIHLTLLPNPSHLETVNTVAMGKARSKMDQIGDDDGSKVLSCLIHGDAAMAGQGIVYETIQMESLKNYHVGGSIHVVINNQVGFTTDPSDARSTEYCTDVAKTLSAFVIHVNAQSPEHVDWAFKLAVEYNVKFRKDVFIDLIGYRKYGHNEQDMPKFTQPLMYKKIEKIEPMWKLYCNQLIKEGVIDQAGIDARIEGFREVMQKGFDNASSGNLELKEWDSSTWGQMVHPSGEGVWSQQDTGVPREKL